MEREAEFILLTHGGLIALVVPPEDQTESQRKKNAVVRKFERAIEWKDLACVSPHDEDDWAWEVIIRGIKGQERLTFVAPSNRQQQAWLDAMETVLVQHHMHENSSLQELGWQYRIVQKPAFSFAVTDDDDGLGFCSETLNTLDVYNGYAPLHYAVRLGNEQAVKVFLSERADPNIKDRDGLTPVYYAVQDEVSECILKLLESHGASGITQTKKDRDELIDRVVATKCEREERREREVKAAAAQAQMNENMRLLNERGQKIQDADDKARELNQNAQQYASLARQLKEQTKRQAGWNPFK